MQKYEVVKDLGTGSYGKVVLARNKRTSELVAIKEIMMTNMSDEEKDKSFKEVNLLKSLDHPNIISLKDSFQDKGHLYIVMEYIDGGDLADKIKQRQSGKPFTEDEIMKIFIQLTLALNYCHEHKIVHRDIKPQNVFLTKSFGVAKLGDFGVARALEATQELCQTIIGTPYYLSPEVWNNEPYNGQTDIWSLGCILYEMCALKRPFTGRDAGQLFAMVVRGKYDPLSSKYSKNLRMLVDSMLNPSPIERPTAAQILQLPFIKKRVESMINDNESQLKTVNIIVSEPQMTRRQKKAPSAMLKNTPQQKPKAVGVHLPKLKSKPDFRENIDLELPLPPDEEAPPWALRTNNKTKHDTIIMNEPDVEVPQEYEDLQDATDELHKSLSLRSGEIPLWARSLESDQVSQQADASNIEVRINEIRQEIEQKLGQQLMEMLMENLANEDEMPSAADFIDLINQDDPGCVEKARELLELENQLG